MGTQNLCDELLERKYGEVVADKKLRTQFHHCLNHMIFEIDGLRFSYEEGHVICIEFPAEFFDQPDFLWNGKLSDARIRKFYESLKSIQRELKNFYVDSLVKPSSTNLRLKLKFPLVRCVERGKYIEDTPIKNIFVKLKDLWSKICYKVIANYKYNVL